jgi:hypothetical protein
MSDVFTFYVVDEDSLPDDLSTLSDDEKYNVLVTAIESEGVLQFTIEMSVDDFVDGLEAIDELVEGDRFIPNNVMNNSPNNVIDKSAECPYLGFFSAGDAHRAFTMLEALTEELMERIESSDIHSEVFHTLFGAFQSAVDSSCALAVIHS